MGQEIIFLMIGVSIGIASLGCSPSLQTTAPSTPVVQGNTVQGNTVQAQEFMSERSQEQTLTLDQLAGTEWLLEDLGGAGVMDYLQTTLQFDEANRISGQGGCNRYSATTQLSGEESESSFMVGAVASTRMMCTPAAMNQETRYFQALQSAQRIKLEGFYLLIYSEKNAAPLRFTRIRAYILESATDESTTNESAADSTLVAFEGRRNAVRIFTQNGQTLMNVYDKQERVTWIRANPIGFEQTPEGGQYKNIHGEVQVTVFVPSSGETPILTINGKIDR